MPTFRQRAAIRDALLSLNPSRRDYMGLRKVLMNFILEEVAERHYKAFQKKRFGGRDEFNRRWARLAPFTVQKKGHRQIGYESGKMDASFSPGYTTSDGFYVRGHPDQIAEATAHSVKFGTKVVKIRRGRRIPYPSFFHDGTQNQPARRFWGPRDPVRWVRAGIRKGLPHVKRLMQREVRR